jgi:predicted nucleotidyltransferase
MAEQVKKDKLTTEEKLRGLVARLSEAAAANLESVVLYGSAARGDFNPERSDLNVLCVFRSLAVEELSRVAPVVRWWAQEQNEPAPLFFTREELRQSADVFAIELRDIRDSHRVLFGPDVLAGVELPTNLHRVQVEHELRTALLKLRIAYVRAPGDVRELAPLLRKSFSSVLTLLRHVIIAFGEEPPRHSRDIIHRACALCGSDSGAFESVLHAREHGDDVADVTKIYGNYLAELENVIRALDRHLPKVEWQRSSKARS